MCSLCYHCKHQFTYKCQNCLQPTPDGSWKMQFFESNDPAFMVSTTVGANYQLPEQGPQDQERSEQLHELTSRIGDQLCARGCMACKHRGNYSRCIGCMQTVNGVLSLTAFEQLGMDRRVQ